MKQPQADILTVSYHNERHIRINASLIQRLNPGTDYRYIVVKNGGELSESEKLPQVVLQSGASRTTSEKGDGSYHHAAGLYVGLKQVRSRFLIIQDPDFFVVKQGWISWLVDYMEKKNLSFFGSLWSPVKPRKYRRFPSIHFMAVDLQKVAIESLKFEPDIWKGHLIKSTVEKLPIPRSFRRALLVGHSRDTGYKIFKKFSRSKRHRTEQLTSVVNQKDFKKLDQINPYPKWFIPYVPERWNVFPHKDTYQFSSCLGPECSGKNGWEEFTWEKELFAIHLRNVGRQENESRENDIPKLQGVLDKKLGISLA